MKSLETRIEERVPDLETATRLTAAGFVQPISAELQADVANHLEAEIGLTYVHEGQDRAYAVLDTYSVGSKKVLYLSGVIIDPTLQARGVGHELIEYARSMSNADLLAFRTQSPRMFALGEKATSVIYPRTPDRIDIPAQYLDVGDSVAAQMNGAFPFQPGVYGGESLYGAPQSHPKQAFMDTLCNAAMGDAVLFLGEFSGLEQ